MSNEPIKGAAKHGQLMVFVVEQPGANLFTLRNASTGEFHVALNHTLETNLYPDEYFEELLLKYKEANRKGYNYIEQEDAESESESDAASSTATTTTREELICYEELSASARSSPEPATTPVLSQSSELLSPLCYDSDIATSPQQPLLISEQSAPSTPQLQQKKRGRLSDGGGDDEDGDGDGQSKARRVVVVVVEPRRKKYATRAQTIKF